MKIKILACLLILVSLLGCPNYSDDSTIILINNSSDTLLYYDIYNKTGDTLLKNNSIYPTEETKKRWMLLPNSQLLFPGRFKNLFEEMPEYQYVMFLFEKQTVDSVSWDIIKSNYLVLRRYDLSLADLEEMNWTITYP
jgi:hypothetical protein